MIVEIVGTREQVERFWALHDQVTDRYLETVAGPALFTVDVMSSARFESAERAQSFSDYNLSSRYATVPVRVEYTQIVRVWTKEDISVDE